MSDQPTKTRRIPRGVVLIGSLLIVIAFFCLGSLLIPTATLAQANLTRPLLFSLAVVTSVLAYGLFQLRRWAWFATLSFVVVQAYFILLGTITQGGTQYVGLIVLAIIAGYLLTPPVRAVFLPRS